MNIDAARLAIEEARRTISAEVYRDYTDAMNDRDPLTANEAMTLEADIDETFVKLLKRLDQYLDARTASTK